MTDPVCGEEAVTRAVREGCTAMDVHLRCSYPDCACKKLPVGIRAAIQAHTAALREAGLKIVAREPLEPMIDAGDDICPIARGTESHKMAGGVVPEDYWRAMWDAAPPYPPDTEGK